MFIRTESFRDYLKEYPIIATIAAINILIYLLTVIPFFPNTAIVQTLIGSNFLIAQGEIWRLITPIFLHVDFSHFLMNTFAVIIFSPFLEKFLGKWTFLNLYLFSGILANLATFIIESPLYLHLGASGSFYGLFGFYLALIMLRKNQLPQQVRQSIVVIVVLGVIFTLIQPNINLVAHLFGAISGFGFGYFYLKKQT